MKRTLAFFLCLLLMVSGGVALASEASGIAEKQVYRRLRDYDLSSWNYLIESSGSEYANFVEGLTENDVYGIPQPCAAESWEISEDGTVYTFHLRKDAMWYTHKGEEYAPVTAHDFVFTGKQILDPNYGSKTSDIYMSLIKNGTEYFEGKCSWDDVGIKALDDYTLQYTLKGKIGYFMSVLTYVCFLPANEKFFNECVVDGTNRFGTSNEFWLYNGGYIMTEWKPQVICVGTKNEKYWDKDRVHIEKLEWVYNAEAQTLGPVMVKSGEISYASIASNIVEAWMDDPETAAMVRPLSLGSSSYSYWFGFNFWPTFDESIGGSHETWMKCANNLNFRKSFFHALDRVAAVETREPYSPESKLNNNITLPDFAFANGKSYAQMGELAKFTNEDSYNPDLALEFKAKAMEELKAQGVEFPVKVYCPYNTGSNTEWTKRAQIVEQQMEGLLGTDYIDIILDGYPNTGFLNATRRAGNYAWMECYWGADYQDPLSYTDPFRGGQKYQYLWFADGLAEKAEENEAGARQTFDGGWWKNLVYDKMVEEADAIVDPAKRLEALANAEAWLIENAFVTPFSTDEMGYCVAFYNPFELAFDPFGISDDKFKGARIYNEPMGFDLYEEALEKWLEEKDAAIAALAK